MLRKKLSLAVICATVFTSAGALAHDGATGVVKERMDLMKTIGKNTKMIGAMAGGAADMDFKAVEAGANEIASAAKMVAHKFPEGSLDEKSEAKANIWTDWPKFSGLVESLANDAGQLEAAAKTNTTEAVQAAFGKMTTNCKNCHTEFRQKKQ